jgi:hypothetical protein
MLTDAQIEKFRCDGYTWVPDVLITQEAKQLNETADPMAAVSVTTDDNMYNLEPEQGAEHPRVRGLYDPSGVREERDPCRQRIILYLSSGSHEGEEDDAHVHQLASALTGSCANAHATVSKDPCSSAASTNGPHRTSADSAAWPSPVRCGGIHLYGETRESSRSHVIRRVSDMPSRNHLALLTLLWVADRCCG